MYAARSSLPFGINPAGLGFAVAVNGAIAAAMIFLIAPNIIPKPPVTILNAEQIPIPPAPPPKPVEKQQTPEKQRESVIYQPPVANPISSDNSITTTTERPVTPPLPDLGEVGGAAEVKAEPPKPIPPLIGARPDPRFASAFQPDYPSYELRREREGTVSVRVLIGTDGRVKAVEQVSATSSAFFDATRRHAMDKWRFKPATRGGTPEESWKVMSVRFELTGQ